MDRIEHGTFEDLTKIRTLAAEHDIVINTGSSFDPALSQTIVDGLKQRKGDKKGTLIHVSGGGNFIDLRTDGKYSPNSKVWNVSVVAKNSSPLGRLEVFVNPWYFLRRMPTRTISNKSTAVCSTELRIACKSTLSISQLHESILTGR